MQQGPSSPLTLSTQQAQEIASLVGLRSPVYVTEVTQNNHVWRLQSEAQSYFVKVYTKDWYGDEESFTCFGEDRWRGSRQELLTRLLAAKNWRELFMT